MILLFTSNHCILCNIIKGMLEHEETDIADVATVYEVNVEKHPLIAEAYGIMVVPTLVAGCKALYGVPSESELRSFILQAAVGGSSQEADNDMEPALDPVHHRRSGEASIRDRPCLSESKCTSAGAVRSPPVSQSIEPREKLLNEKEQPNPPLQQ
jgi:thioredoxin-like negative regulator of GroEL